MGEIELAFHVSAWPDEEFVMALAGIADAGFRAMECRANVVPDYEDRVQVFQEMLLQQNVTLAAIETGLRPVTAEILEEEIERCAESGVRGVGEIRPDIQLLDLEDESIVSPLMEVIQKHRLILLTHASEPAGHDYPGKGIITPDVLYPFITGHPDATIVCAHWGGGLPFYALMPEVKKALNNVYFDTAASPFLYQPRIYSLVSELVGVERVLFGSDYPLMPQSRPLQEINSAGLTEEDRDLILSGNAKRLLKL